MPVDIPEPIRAAAGLAVTVLGQARQLPANIVALPVRAAGLAMQAALRLQQSYAGLVVKGDELLTHIRRPDDEDPPWATFDEDVVIIAEGVTERLGTDVTAAGEPAGSASPSPRSDPELAPLPGTTRIRPTAPASGPARLGQAPSAFDLAEDRPVDVVDESVASVEETVSANGQLSTSGPPVPGYDALTLAQLRARLRTFDAAALTSLLDYERQQRARAPFLSMLENRLNRRREQD